MKWVLIVCAAMLIGSFLLGGGAIQVGSHRWEHKGWLE